jgi:hypothetical protein
MADKQIKELDEATSVTDSDILLMQSASSDETEKVTLATVKDYMSPAWPSYVPTFSNFTLGDGTLTAHYLPVGNKVDYHIEIQLGTTSSMSTGITFTLPVAASTAYGVNVSIIGKAVCYRAADGATFGASAFYLDTTHAGILVLGAAGTYTNYVPITSSVPIIWTSADKFTITGSYEIA